MEQYAFYAIAGSVLMHVTWNLLARHVNAKCNYLWWGLLAHLILLGPWGLWSLWRDANWSETLLWTIIITSTSNAVYFLSLRHAYRHAAVSLVYPLARSSPLLIAIWGVLLFDNTINMWGWLGIVISVVGLIFLSLSNHKQDRAATAISWALLAAFCTSIYSLSDKVAVNYLPNFGSKVGFISIGYFISFLALTLHNQFENRQWLPKCRPNFIYILLGGLTVGTAYALIIHAMTWISAAYAVALSNSGIILATLISIYWFGEKKDKYRRLFAVAVIAIGLSLIALFR